SRRRSLPANAPLLHQIQHFRKMSHRIPTRVIRNLDHRRKMSGRYNFRAGWMEQPLQCRIEYRRAIAEQIRAIRQRRTVELAAILWDDFGFVPMTSEGEFIGRKPA